MVSSPNHTNLAESQELPFRKVDLAEIEFRKFSTKSVSESYLYYESIFGTITQLQRFTIRYHLSILYIKCWYVHLVVENLKLDSAAVKTVSNTFSSSDYLLRRALKKHLLVLKNVITAI
ncbi:uncharacterized protein LOC114335431 [Diabrotica virgifera virgifera]|uniref:Uncharacterized protein n=1 Tax=Diabrotica virgifera virgifera TaxID=50390 RepID=A0ABM5JSS4_DIAVI|nr:uncharacterized protein LOC114335431 [Diabrotica virgifera virgifera]